MISAVEDFSEYGFCQAIVCERWTWRGSGVGTPMGLPPFLGAHHGKKPSRASSLGPPAKVRTCRERHPFKRVQDRYNLSVPYVLLHTLCLPTVPQNQRDYLTKHVLEPVHSRTPLRQSQSTSTSAWPSACAYCQTKISPALSIEPLSPVP